jgi:hypothetical protein
MKKLLVVLVTTGALLAGCNVKVPPSHPCPSGYHRLQSAFGNYPSGYCGPDKS